ncbi:MULTISPECIES: hypothetical protein [Massilia]|jgi:hypothetical protein|uniref:Uncharacterized protein n=1 Tax=Massilia haematophila TaxID=457923 RepID=A0ABV7PT90_9BURK|nr:hypothetical protein [Massilia sp.]
MSAATITQAQDKGLRHQSGLFATIRQFCEQLYVAHGGWLFGARKDAAQQARVARNELLSLAAQSESFSPNLAAELRHLANRG